MDKQQCLNLHLKHFKEFIQTRMKAGEEYSKDTINTKYLLWTPFKDKWYFCMDSVIQDAIEKNLLFIPGRGERGATIFSKVNGATAPIDDDPVLKIQLHNLQEGLTRLRELEEKNHTFIQVCNRKIYTLQRNVTFLLKRIGEEWNDYKDEYDDYIKSKQEARKLELLQNGSITS